jgi:hypothetical protein
VIANDIMGYFNNGITHSVIYNSTRKTKCKHHFHIITILLEGSEIGDRLYSCFAGDSLSFFFFFFFHCPKICFCIFFIFIFKCLYLVIEYFSKYILALFGFVLGGYPKVFF